MVKVRDPQKPSQPKKAALSEAEKAAKAESFGNEAIPKKPREKPFKAITLPFWSKEEHERLVEAASKANMKHTSFMIKAVKDAIDKELKKH